MAEALNWLFLCVIWTYCVACGFDALVRAYRVGSAILWLLNGLRAAGFFSLALMMLRAAAVV